jgi:hypothetical protein
MWEEKCWEVTFKHRYENNDKFNQLYHNRIWILHNEGRHVDKNKMAFNMSFFYDLGFLIKSSLPTHIGNGIRTHAFF